jgi:hypothetical protein
VEAADAGSVVGQTLSLRSVPERSAEPVTILMGEVGEVPHPETGEIMLHRRDVSSPVEMYEYGTFTAEVSETAPAAYLVPAELTDVIERLEIHGVEMAPLSGDRDLTVEAFMVDSASTAERAFQNRYERQLWGTYVEDARQVPSGTIVVSVGAPLGRLAFHLLEPVADDGFANWGILDDWIRAGEEYPILRSHQVVVP